MQAIIDYLKELSPAGLLFHIALLILAGMVAFTIIPNSFLKSGSNKDQSKLNKEAKAQSKLAKKQAQENQKANQTSNGKGFSLFNKKNKVPNLQNDIAQRVPIEESTHSPSKRFGIFSRTHEESSTTKSTKTLIAPEYSDEKNPRSNKFIFKRAKDDPTYFKHPPVTDYFAKVVKPEPSTNLKAPDLDELDSIFTTMIKAGAISSKKFLVTSYEHQYLEKLRMWFGYKYHIYCQVSVGSTMKIDAEVSELNMQQRRKFAQKCHNMSYDFMLIDKETDRIVCAIELDDPTHQRYDRIARDRRLDKVSQAAEIPLFHITNINQKPDLSRLA